MAADQSSSSNSNDRPFINVTNSTAAQIMSSVLQYVIDGQQRTPRLFTQHGGVLVRLRDNGKGPLEVLTPAMLKLELDRAIEFRKGIFEKGGKAGYVVAEPPRDVVNGILASDRFADYPELPELRRVCEAPYFTKDGELVAASGYHVGARAYLRPSTLLTNLGTTKPTVKDVDEARKLLTVELLGDFPFTTPASRAHMLALLITPFVRDMIGGPVPLAVIIAPMPAAGKSKLATVASLIATGAQPHVMSGNVEDQEVEKRITSLLLEAAPYGLFDNVAEGGKVNSPTLAAMLTAEYWSGRKLRESKMLNLPNVTQWIITGNGLEFTGEIARRSFTIALDPKTDKPQERTGFRHPELERWIKEQRPALVRSILVLVQHWIASGRPSFIARTQGSFEGWSHVVGGVLQASALDEGFLTPTIAAGHTSPFTPATATVANADANMVRLVEHWATAFGSTPRHVGQLIECAPDGLVNGSNERSRSMALGHLLRKNEGRVFLGHKIIGGDLRVRDEERREDRPAWRLERTS